MNHKRIEDHPKSKLFKKIDKELEGYWASDIWDVRLCPVLEGTWKRHNVFLKFVNIKQPILRNEIKYYYFKRLTEYSVSPETVWRSYIVHELARFLEQRYPSLVSILDVEKEIMLRNYKAHLIKHGKPVRKGKYNSNSEFVRLLLQLHDYFLSFYDDSDELSKDIWNFKNLNMQYDQVSSLNIINFSYIPIQYRELVKRYIKERLFTHQDIAGRTASTYTRTFSLLFSFIIDVHPNWNNLIDLSREDIIEFINRLRRTPRGGHSNVRHFYKDTFLSPDRISVIINHVEVFINYIQRFEWKEAPLIPCQKLIVREDKNFKNRNVNLEDKIKYIPDEIWTQVLDNIEFLPNKLVPILIVLEASGFRSIDVLSLKLDCLLKKEDGWWLVGDQSKVKHKSHKVPISDEVAKTIIAQQKLTKQLTNQINNPHNYLFPTLSGVRVGKPISPHALSRNLNQLAQKCDIRDQNGEIYYFKNHGFRHRYGVNLINNGMKIIHVQKLMAHASPEMTLVYAQIHDRTLRQEWEKARGKGAIRFEESGELISTDLISQAEENGIELEWIRHNLDSIRLDHGFCIKSPKLNCDFLNQSLDPPCIKNNCRSFHVDHTFLSYYEEQVVQMEEDIKIYKRTNRERQIELISEKLKRYKQIIQGLKKGEGIYGISKEKRESNPNKEGRT